MRDEADVQLEVFSGRGIALARGVGGGKGDAAAIVFCEDLAEDLVESFDERLGGAEVGREADGVEVERVVVMDFETGFTDAGEELGIGIAEEVDGLHGVADDKTTAAFALGPGGDEAAEKFVLAAAGVLKLVNEDVVDAVGDGEGGVGGKAIGSTKNSKSDLSNFDVVDGADFREYDFELGYGVAEQSETGADDLPVVLGVAGRGQIANGGDGGHKAGDNREARDEVEHLCFFNLTFGWKADALVYLLAKAAIFCEEEIGEAKMGVVGIFEGFDFSGVVFGKIG